MNHCCHPNELCRNIDDPHHRRAVHGAEHRYVCQAHLLSQIRFRVMGYSGMPVERVDTCDVEAFCGHTDSHGLGVGFAE